jgi:hypothetical protein
MSKRVAIQIRPRIRIANLAGPDQLRVARPKLERTSILLDPALVAKLSEKAARRGLPGYQTMLKLIVAEHIDEY